MADTTYILPESSVWEPEIYQLEVTDKALGYNPATEMDGPANQQWKQLANRTRYLKDTLEKEHGEDGTHKLTNAGFLDDARIPEVSLALDVKTSELNRRIIEILADMQDAQERADRLDNVNLSFSGALVKLIPLCQEYSTTRSFYELFSGNIEGTAIKPIAITKEIQGDDSLDVVDTTGVQVGHKYILCDADGGNYEEAVVMSVLTENRIRFTTALTHTRTSGYMGYTNLIPTEDGALATGSFLYVLGETDVLTDAIGGYLYLHRDRGTVIERLVQYKLTGSDEWATATYSGSTDFVDGTVDDIYSLPPGKMEIRVTYGQCEAPYTVYYIVVRPTFDVIWIEDIRHPIITSVDLTRNNLTVTGNGYASLYDLAQKGMSVQVMRANEFAGDMEIYTVEDQTTTAVMPVPEYLFDEAEFLRVRIRYIDEEDTVSRWSDAENVKVETIKTPVITEYSMDNQYHVSVTGSEYIHRLDRAMKCAELRITSSNTTVTKVISVRTDTAVTTVETDITDSEFLSRSESLLLRIRYIDFKGLESDWSNPVTVQVS